jgi:hypothetical protein
MIPVLTIQECHANSVVMRTAAGHKRQQTDEQQHHEQRGRQHQQQIADWSLVIEAILLPLHCAPPASTLIFRPGSSRKA